MNVLFTKTKKQEDFIRDNLEQFDNLVTSAKSDNDLKIINSLQGEIAASLSLFGQSIRDMDNLCSREMNMSKKIQYKDSIKDLQSTSILLRSHFEELKKKFSQKMQDITRRSLLNSDKKQSSTNNPYGTDHSIPFVHSRENRNISSYRNSIPENQRMDNAANSIDQYIQIGASTLMDLQQQKKLLKGTRGRVLNIANVLGLSQSVIRWIDTRNRNDKYIFYIGVFITLIVLIWTIFHFI